MKRLLLCIITMLFFLQAHAQKIFGDLRGEWASISQLKEYGNIINFSTYEGTQLEIYEIYLSKDSISDQVKLVFHIKYDLNFVGWDEVEGKTVALIETSTVSNKMLEFSTPIPLCLSSKKCFLEDLSAKKKGDFKSNRGMLDFKFIDTYHIAIVNGQNKLTTGALSKDSKKNEHGYFILNSLREPPQVRAGLHGVQTSNGKIYGYGHHIPKLDSFIDKPELNDECANLFHEKIQLKNNPDTFLCHSGLAYDFLLSCFNQTPLKAGTSKMSYWTLMSDLNVLQSRNYCDNHSIFMDASPNPVEIDL